MSSTWNLPLLSSGTPSADFVKLNDAAESLRTLHSSGTAPAAPVAFMLWLDTSTTPDTLKMRNAANGAWVTIVPDVTATGGGLLPLTGGTMSGAIAMGSTKVTGLANGTASGDAVNKGQVDAQPQVFACYIAGFAATLNRPAFVATANLTVTAAYLLSDTATAGSGAGTKYDFQLRNGGTAGAGTTDMLTAAKSTNGAEIGAYDSYDLGAFTTPAMAVGEGMQLRVTMTGTPTSLSAAQIQLVIHYTTTI